MDSQWTGQSPGHGGSLHGDVILLWHASKQTASPISFGMKLWSITLVYAREAIQSSSTH